MNASEIGEAAAWLARARREGRAARACPQALALTEEDAGYTVQESLHEALGAAGMGDLVGYKIGCTNRVMQEALNVPGPAYGGLLAANLHRDEADFALNGFQAPGVECEIAVWIGRDTALAEAPFDRQSIGGYVAACSAAMEIVDNRYEDFRSAPFGLMIADDFFQAASVVGPRVEAWRGLDLAEVTGRARIDGEVVATGTGRNVLGHPLEAVSWLANRLADRGRGLRTGQLVLTGTMVPCHWLDAAPAEAVMELDGLGRTTARFS
jgi:2-keto-4-pentenoate hydratase